MKGCCVSHTQPGRRLADLEFRSEAGIAGHLGLEDVQAHDVVRGIVENQIQVLEVHDAVQPLGKFMEQLAEIAVLGNRFGHFQQRPMLRLRRSGGQFASGDIVHRLENNTPGSWRLNSAMKVKATRAEAKWRRLQPVEVSPCKL